MALKSLAQFFSIVFHPLLGLTYMLLLLLLLNPYLFGVNNLWDSRLLIILVFGATFLFPLIVVLLMRALDLIGSVTLEEREDRILPYIGAGVFYMATFWQLYHYPNIPVAFKICCLGATISLFVAFFINNFSKISLHAVGMGGLLGMIMIATALFSYGFVAFNVPKLGYMELNNNVFVMIVLVICGLVGSSRLLLSAHTLQELYGGFVVGILGQFIALHILT